MYYFKRDLIKNFLNTTKSIQATCFNFYFLKNPTKYQIKLVVYLQSTVFMCVQGLFGREADKLEHANDDERTYYLIENEPLVNKFISKPKDKGSLNCAVFTAGIIEAILNSCGFVSIQYVCN